VIDFNHYLTNFLKVNYVQKTIQQFQTLFKRLNVI